MQLHLVVVLIGGGIKHAVGFNEHDSLALSVFDPQDKVWVKARILKESDAFAPAKVAQQVKSPCPPENRSSACGNIHAYL